MPDVAAARQSTFELDQNLPSELSSAEALQGDAAPLGSDTPVLQNVSPAESAEVMDAAWLEVMEALQSELSGPTYQNYLRHVRPLRLTAEKLTLSAPSDFVKDWLVRRFASRIEATLEQFLGRPVLLGFQITAEPGAGGVPLPGTATNGVPAAGGVGKKRGAPGADELETAANSPAEALAAQTQYAEEAMTAEVSGSRGAPEPATHQQASQMERRGQGAGGLQRHQMDEFEDFSSPLNKKYTFDNFIVGRSNYVSHAAAWAVACAPAKGQYIPLFIYGGVGLGKTHLMQAIGHHINKVRGNPVEIAYVSGENFLYQVVRCIREDRMTAFRRRYRNVDVWLVDDIQYICNAERTEVEFFHIFNTLYDQGKQIVICSDKPPKDLQLTESRLISRFEWGLISYVEPPDLEHRIAILQKRALADNVNVPTDVLVYLAEKIRSNIRSLEGSLTRLLAMASLDGRKINLDLAAETVRYYSTAQAEPVKVEVGTIIEVVADHFKIPVSDLLGKKRNKEIVVPRQIAMFLAREMANMSYPDIGRAFDRDYTTVIHSFEKVKAEIKKDSSLKTLVSEIRSRAHARG